MTIRERLQQADATDSIEAVIARCELAAERFRLPFSRNTWRGLSGNWSGAGVGSSIDFQDHRPYVPGDDPRYINWQAYARSGHYSMKLYREEVSPQVDIVLDVTDSIFVDPAKAIRALELFYFACHSAWRNAALLNSIVTRGKAFALLDADSVRAGNWQLPDTHGDEQKAVDWMSLPWRAQSMRLVISDFLFDEDPAHAVSTIAQRAGAVVFWAVYTESEMSPDWLGNVELLDCESNKRISRYFVQEDIDQFRQRYDAHFTRWADSSARHAASLARINARGSIAEQLLAVSSISGGVELCH